MKPLGNTPLGAHLGFGPKAPPVDAALVVEGEAADATMEAIQATGASFTEALAMTAQVHGCEAAVAMPGLARMLVRSPLEQLVYLVNGLAQEDPELARQAYAVWAWAKGYRLAHLGDFDPGRTQRFDNSVLVPEGARGWCLDVSKTNRIALPKGLVCVSLNAFACQDLTSLPKGLKAECLDLACTGIRTLPAGLNVHSLTMAYSDLESLPWILTVRETLDLRNCERWDGRIPLGTEVGKLRTTKHPDGITLGAWRWQHPFGERFRERP
jgi:hypothetical protein